MCIRDRSYSVYIKHWLAWQLNVNLLFPSVCVSHCLVVVSNSIWVYCFMWHFCFFLLSWFLPSCLFLSLYSLFTLLFCPYKVWQYTFRLGNILLCYSCHVTSYLSYHVKKVGSIISIIFPMHLTLPLKRRTQKRSMKTHEQFTRSAHEQFTRFLEASEVDRYWTENQFLIIFVILL